MYWRIHQFRIYVREVSLAYKGIQVSLWLMNVVIQLMNVVFCDLLVGLKFIRSSSSTFTFRRTWPHLISILAFVIGFINFAVKIRPHIYWTVS
jgi:hypothetical protein